MASCRIVNASVVDAVDAIAKISGDYKTAGENLISSLTSALSEMEGATKDALEQFINNTVKVFVEDELPAAIEGMSNLLEANRQNFEDLDAKIAAGINGG